MKKLYTTPNAKILAFTTDDVLNTSFGEDNVGNTGTLFGNSFM